MPTRIRQWNSSQCIAEQNNLKQLDEIKEKVLQAKHRLEELSEKRQLIDKIVERGKKEKVKEEESEEEGVSDYRILSWCAGFRNITVRSRGISYLFPTVWMNHCLLVYWRHPKVQEKLQ